MSETVTVEMEVKHVALLLWIIQTGHHVWAEFDEVYRK